MGEETLLTRYLILIWTLFLGLSDTLSGESQRSHPSSTHFSSDCWVKECSYFILCFFFFLSRQNAMVMVNSGVVISLCMDSWLLLLLWWSYLFSFAYFIFYCIHCAFLCFSFIAGYLQFKVFVPKDNFLIALTCCTLFHVCIRVHFDYKIRLCSGMYQFCLSAQKGRDRHGTPLFGLSEQYFPSKTIWEVNQSICT